VCVGRPISVYVCLCKHAFSLFIPFYVDFMLMCLYSLSLLSLFVKVTSSMSQMAFLVARYFMFSYSLFNMFTANMVWYGMVWYGMVWYGMIWYCMVWYGIV